MSEEELNEMLLANEMEGTAFFVNPAFETAIIGKTEDGALVYLWEQMVDQLSEEDGITPEEAVEFIDYNTLRTIPYMNGIKPIIVYPIF